jgi:hypothetical protein
MGFSAIIPAVDVADANAVLEAAGFGSDNFVVPLMQGTWRTEGFSLSPPAAYGMSVGGNAPDFRDAVAAIPRVDVRDAEGDASEFDQHLAALGLSREPTPELTEDL